MDFNDNGPNDFKVVSKNPEIEQMLSFGGYR